MNNAKKARKNYLSNILCCINFNEAYYRNIDFLKNLYGSFFDIVFYGPENDENSDIIQIQHDKGFFG